MSDYHILTADKYGNKYQVVFHIPIPDIANSAGVDYRTAVVEFLTQGGATITSNVADATELTQLQAGELVEVTETFYSHPGETLIQKRDRLDSRFASLTTEIQDLWQTKLGYWGYERDVV